MIDIAIAGAAHAAHHAVAAGAARDGLPRAGDEIIHALHPIDRDIGARDFGLGAISAVLRTDAALRVAQHAKLDAAAERGLAYAPGREQQIVKTIVRPIDDRARNVAIK